MKNFVWSALVVLSMLFSVYLGHADAVPDIRGDYSGSYSMVVSNCSDSSDNGTYYAILELSISNQTGSDFSGSATGSFEIDNTMLVEYIQLSGTIAESGQIIGTTTHTFLDTAGAGTFTGQLNGNALSIENSGQDTSGGDTCSYIRYMSATREGIPASASFSAVPTSGNAPLSVNFTDESTGTITSWYWNFGDGTTSAIQNPSHVYTFEGKYSVSLTITGPYGSDAETKTDYISVAGNLDVKQLKVRPLDSAAIDYFGCGVSISGDYAIVGSYFDDDNGNNSGSAYIFERNGISWNQVAKLTADDGAADDHFGYNVSISGGYAIVGAFRDDDNGMASGSAYIFEKSESGWNQVAKLTADDGAEGDFFGYDVSISGGYAFVGANYDDDNGENSGSTYIFERSDSGWNQVAKLTADDGAAYNYFGSSVSISGGYAIVSAWLDDDNGFTSGSAYIFERIGGSWNQVAKLTASDGAAGDYFGFRVSICGEQAIVGARGDNDNGEDSGSAYIFERIGGRWKQAAKLTAGDGAAGDYFGSGVSISSGYAVVSANYDDDNGTASGSAYIFKRRGNNWHQKAKLTSGDGAAYDLFGQSVSIDIGCVIVGAMGNEGNSGSAYFFDLPIPNDDSMPWLPLLLFNE